MLAYEQTGMASGRPSVTVKGKFKPTMVALSVMGDLPR